MKADYPTILEIEGENWQDPDPQTGKLGTRVPAVWLQGIEDSNKAITLEVLSVLAEANIKPNELNNTQLRDAVIKIVTDRLKYTNIEGAPKIIDALGDSKKDAASQRIVNVVNKLAKDAMTAAMLANEKANSAQQEAEKKLNPGDFGFGGYSERATLEYLFNTPKTGLYYTVDSDDEYIDLTPEKRSIAYVLVQNHYGSDNYIKLTWSYSTGSKKTYEIRKVNGVLEAATEVMTVGNLGIGGYRVQSPGFLTMFEPGLTFAGDPSSATSPFKRAGALLKLGAFQSTHIHVHFGGDKKVKFKKGDSRDETWDDEVEFYTTASTTISSKGFLRGSGSKEAVTTDELAVTMSKSKTQAVTPFLLDAELTKREQQDTRKRVDVTQERVKDVEYINSTDMPIDIVMVVSTHSVNTQSIVKLLINDEVIGHTGFLLSGTAFISYEMKTQITATVQPNEKYKFTASSNALIEKFWEFRK